MRGRTATPAIAILMTISGCGAATQLANYQVPIGVLTMAPGRDEPPTTHVGRAELLALQETSLETALERLRPEWLRVNPSSRQVEAQATASVYVDDMYMGGLESLRLVPVATVVELRYLSPSRANDWFGTGCRCGAGVIFVTTRNRR